MSKPRVCMNRSTVILACLSSKQAFVVVKVFVLFLKPWSNSQGADSRNLLDVLYARSDSLCTHCLIQGMNNHHE